MDVYVRAGAGAPVCICARVRSCVRECARKCAAVPIPTVRGCPPPGRECTRECACVLVPHRWVSRLRRENEREN